MNKEERDQLNKKIDEDLRILADVQRFVFVIASAVATFTANIWYIGIDNDNKKYFILSLFLSSLLFIIIGILFYVRIKLRDKY